MARSDQSLEVSYISKLHKHDFRTRMKFSKLLVIPMPCKMKHLPPEINFSLTDQTQCTVYVLCNRNFKVHKFLNESLISKKIHYFHLK